MTSPLDILRCAKLLCDQYGAEADLIAAVCADKLLELGEIEGRHDQEGLWAIEIQTRGNRI